MTFRHNKADFLVVESGNWRLEQCEKAHKLTIARMTIDSSTSYESVSHGEIGENDFYVCPGASTTIIMHRIRTRRK